MALRLLQILIISILVSQFGTLQAAKEKRQDVKEEEEEEEELSSATCDFGSGAQLTECFWTIPSDSGMNVKWSKGQGSTAYWLGGPLVDHTLGDSSGGYIYFETSYKVVDRVFSSAGLESIQSAVTRVPIKADPEPDKNSWKIEESQSNRSMIRPGVFTGSIKERRISEIPDYANFISPNISKTGPIGHCIGFYYNIDGLSADKLRVLVKGYETDANQTLWESSVHTDTQWIKAEIVYTYEKYHQIVLEGISRSATEPERSYRGYVAVDDIQILPIDETSGLCHGHCTFEGSMCGWTNQEEGDDFDWNLGRGSDNLFTGPARDFYSFSREYPLGGFIYIDAGYPRRPGDKAILISPLFQPTVVCTQGVYTTKPATFTLFTEDGPICFKFATHMYGNGVGILRVKYKSEESEDDKGGDKGDRILWEMSGEAGNNWYTAQLPIASSTSFHIIFEGIVGPNYLGNIAVDSISLEQGVCPISPQTAARGSGDCTFEENMCQWINPNAEAGLDDFDWVRQFSYGSFGPKYDHTKKNKNGYYLSLNDDHLQPKRGGTSAWIISPEFSPVKGSIKCMSFYYFMYQRVIESGGPSLGGLRVYIRTTNETGETVLIPIWRLNNHQSLKWRRAQVPLAVKLANSEMSSPSQIYQVVIEGIWGDARVGSIALDDISFFDGHCKAIPVNAEAVKGECSFDKNFCDWKIDSPRLVPANSPGHLTSSLLKGSLISHKNTAPPTIHSYPSSKQSSPVLWKLASSSSRPTSLQDHTFRAPVGYVYFDAFNQNTFRKPVLRSPKFTTIEDDQKEICLSFWFSGFGRGNSITLNIYLVIEETEAGDTDVGESLTSTNTDSVNEVKKLIWSIQTRSLDTRRNLWYYGQTPIEAESPYQILIEGVASDGGFAVDDITFYNGTCQTRPSEASVVKKVETDT